MISCGGGEVPHFSLLGHLPCEKVFQWQHLPHVAAAAAKSFRSRPTLCNPRDGSPPSSPVPGILQARTLEWVAISFSNARKWKLNVKSLSRVRLLATPWTAAHQAPPSRDLQARVLEWGATAFSAPASWWTTVPKHRKVTRWYYLPVTWVAVGGLAFLFPSVYWDTSKSEQNRSRAEALTHAHWLHSEHAYALRAMRINSAVWLQDYSLLLSCTSSRQTMSFPMQDWQALMSGLGSVSPIH